MCSVYIVLGNNVSRENISNILFKEKQLRCENSFYQVFIIVRETTTPLSPLITLCYSPFSLEVYLVEEISFSISFQRMYSIGECLFWYTRLIACMCSMFHLCLVSRLLDVRPMNFTLVNV